jgi:hypothetical protein
MQNIFYALYIKRCSDKIQKKKEQPKRYSKMFLKQRVFKFFLKVVVSVRQRISTGREFHSWEPRPPGISHHTAHLFAVWQEANVFFKMKMTPC